MKKTSKKQKQKEQIITLAEDATSKIIKNRIISSHINNYNKHIELIKSFMETCNKNNKLTDNNISKANNDISFIKKELDKFLNELKNNIEFLKSETNKIRQKYKSNSEIYFTVDLSNKRVKEDAFILSYSLTQKLNIIKKLKESIHSSKDYNIFQEPKRETLIERKMGEENIDSINEDLQRYALYEIKQFNKYYNRTQRKLKKRNLYKSKIQIFNQIINYFRQYFQNKKNYHSISKNQNNIYNNSNRSIIKSKKPQIKKTYKNEDKSNNFYNSTLNNTEINPSTTNDTEIINSLSNSQNLNYTNNIPNNYQNLFPSLTFNKSNQRNSFKKRKIKIPTVEELFDLANNEGEKEAIIDDELHSDEDIVFQPKVKQTKKIITNYLPKVKETVPKISLSLIEYNKIKIMNEADLYSYNKRQEQRGNADENIKLMKKKLKIIKRRCNINQKKLETMKNFVKECENDYHRLMAMKVQMSMKVKVDFMKKEFYNINVKDKIDEEDELNYQKELDEYLNDPELNDPYFQQFQNLQTDITHRQIETENNIFKKINKENLEENKDINDGKKKYDKIKTHRERKKEKIKRANSK